jgi:hypothetical protein
MSLDKEKYGKTLFRELHIDDQAKIRNYSFIFNKLDTSYRKDLNKLKDMYDILNRSSKTLNDYEFNKVIWSSFYDIITRNKDSFMKTKFFSKIKDFRGNIDSELIEMIVLSQDLPASWSSINNLKESWLSEIGETAEGVEKFVTNNGENIEEKLIFMHKIIDAFYQRNFFPSGDDAKRIFKKFFLPYKLIVCRCSYLIPNYAMFNRIFEKITDEFKKILTDDLLTNLDCTSRNAQFQKKLIDAIDKIIENELNKDGNARFFSKKMIQSKLLEQKWICPICKNVIKECDDYEGDHIIPWTTGGKTDHENLQVLHKRCHQTK